MINLLLIRTNVAELDDYTVGILFNQKNNTHICFTLEDKIREIGGNFTKIKGKTAIPFGKYIGKLRLSPKRGRLIPELDYVPYFKNIQIHSGNTIDDTDGCILVGESLQGSTLFNSRIAENKLVKLIQDNGSEFEIEIR